jgi:hypothetical protein
VAQLPDLPTQALPFDDELLEVRRRRYHEAIDAGLTVAEARIFSDNGEDVGLLRRLVALGCPPEYLAAIVV